MWYPTRRAVAFLLISGLIYAFSNFFSLTVGYYICGILLAILFWNALMSWNSCSGIFCERSVSEENREGGEATVTIKVSTTQKNKEGIDLLIRDQFGPSLKSPNVMLNLSDVSLAEDLEVSYTRKCDKRGEYQVGPIIFYAADPFGFFAHRRKINAIDPVIVYPKTFEISDFPTLPLGSTTEFGLSSGNRQGDTGDYYGNREYQLGDSLRIVNWRATAREGELMVKQFEKISDSQVTLMLDLFSDSNIGVGNESTLEVSIRLIGSIAQHLMLKGTLVQFIAHGDHPYILPPGKGSQHLAHCLEMLASLSSNGARSFSELIYEYEDYIKPNTTLVVPVLDIDEAAVEALAAIKKKSVEIVSLALIHEAFKINDSNYPLDKANLTNFYANLGELIYPVKPYSYDELVQQFNSLASFTSIA